MEYSCFLNQFRPLALKPNGRKAISTKNLPPFLDSSCRREPDFESEFPPITCLCRRGQFAPRLQEGDVVAYITAKLAWPARTPKFRRIVALLRVKKSWKPGGNECGLSVHEKAAEWYRAQALTIPNNCMVANNPPKLLDETDLYNESLEVWDRDYRQRASKNGDFHICEKIYCDLSDPPRLSDEQLREWFGKVPGTQNPGALPLNNFSKLIGWLSEQVPEIKVRQFLDTLNTTLSSNPLTENCIREHDQSDH